MSEPAESAVSILTVKYMTYVIRQHKTKCPDIVKNIGTHVAMCYYENGQYYWDYQAVKNAIG